MTDASERHTFTDLTEDPELRLIVVGKRDADLPDSVVVEIDIGDEWTATHQIERVHGVWTPMGDPTFRNRTAELAVRPTARLRRAASLEPHRQRLHDLLVEAFAQDFELWREQASWFDRVAVRWRMTAPRSRRGRRSKIDADEAERLLKKGRSYKEIEAAIGAKKKSTANKISKNKRRTPF